MSVSELFEFWTTPLSSQGSFQLWCSRDRIMPGIKQVPPAYEVPSLRVLSSDTLFLLKDPNQDIILNLILISLETPLGCYCFRNFPCFNGLASFED